LANLRTVIAEIMPLWSAADLFGINLLARGITEAVRFTRSDDIGPGRDPDGHLSMKVVGVAYETAALLQEQLPI
jgi:hypothetical protein